MSSVDRRTFLSTLLVGAAGLSALATVGAEASQAGVSSREGRRKVLLGVTDLSFHRATAAAVTYVLQRMGVEVERKYALHEANFERLRSGEVDMVASAWIPYSHGLYKARVEEVVATRELGLHYTPYAMWGVTEHVPASEVQSVEDLLKPTVLQHMTKRIQGIGPGAGITRFSLNMMQAYGLSAAGYQFFTGTQQDCIGAFEQAQRDGRWAVVPLWHPQFLHNKYTIRELSDPKGLLGGKDRAVLLARVDRLNSQFSTEEIRILDALQLSNATVSQMDYLINREGMGEDAAFHYWRQQPQNQAFDLQLQQAGLVLS